MKGELYYEGGDWLAYTVWERGESIEWNGGGRHPLDCQFAACSTKESAERIVRCVNAHDELVGALEAALPYLEPFNVSPDVSRQDWELMGEEWVAGYQELVARIRTALSRAGKGVEP